MEILIVDDKKEYVDILEKKLFCFFSHLCDTVKFESITIDFDKFDYDKEYDYVFLDIDLKGEDGFEIAKKIKHYNSQCDIVFFSEKNNLIHHSLLFQPFFFIRKSHLEYDLEMFFTLVKNQIDNHLTIILKYKYETSYVKLKDIIFIESKQHVLYIHCKNHVFKDNRSLKNIMCDIDSKDFIQIHKSYLINLRQMISHHNNIVNMAQNNRLTIGRKYKDDFENYYKEYLVK